MSERRKATNIGTIATQPLDFMGLYTDPLSAENKRCNDLEGSKSRRSYFQLELNQQAQEWDGPTHFVAEACSYQDCQGKTVPPLLCTKELLLFHFAQNQST